MFEKDVRDAIQLFGNFGAVKHREKFVRIEQIATLLCLESVGEFYDYWGTSVAWKLGTDEIRKVLGLRMDFAQDEISNLKF